MSFLLRTGKEANIQGKREQNTRLLVSWERMHLQVSCVWGSLSLDWVESLETEKSKMCIIF